MANTNAPFGFQHIGSIGGGAPTFQSNTRKIASTDTTKVFTGDPVMPVTGSATGYVTALVPGTTRVAGIATGFRYFSTSQQKTIFSQYWPGSDATGDVDVQVIDDPNALFRVQADSTGLPFSKIGQNVQVTMGTGNTSTGQSGAFVGSAATTATLPFVIVGVVTDPPGANGTDSTSGYNIVTVTFNNETFKQLTGIS